MSNYRDTNGKERVTESATEARQAIRTSYMRYVLAISLALSFVVLGILYLVFVA